MRRPDGGLLLPDLSLLVAIALGIVSLESHSAGDGMPSLRSLAGTAATVFVTSLLCRLAADRAVRHLEESEPEEARGPLAWTAALPVVGWCAALFAFGWAGFVAEAVPRSWFLVPHLALFAPLAVLLSAGWLATRRVEAHLSPSAPTRAGAIRRGLRRNAIVLVPLAVLLVIEDGIGALAALDAPGFRRFATWREAFPELDALLLLGTVALLALLVPAVVRRALKTRPLEEGDARRAILRAIENAGVRFREILVWPTEGRIVNAMVVGLTSRTRYVFVTDGLLATHPLPEVAAVVAHEAGHAKKRHLVLYFVVSVSLVLLMSWAQDAVLPYLGPMGPHIVTLGFLAVFWFGFVGWLSRRFEREADVFGAEHAVVPDEPPALAPAPAGEGPAVAAEPPEDRLAQGVALYASALERIARRAGAGRSLRHGTIEERVEFLRRYAADPEARTRFRRAMRGIVAAIAAFFLLAVAATASTVPAGLERGRLALRVEEAKDVYLVARAAERAGDRDAARRGFERARDLFAAAARDGEGAKDPLVRLRAALAMLSAAEVDMRHLGRDEDARRENLAGLALLDSLGSLPGGAEDVAAHLRFHTEVDLGRLALRGEGEPGKQEAEARRRLGAARSIPDEVAGGAFARARLRLLESAIRLRDPAQAEQARKDLRAQASTRESGDEWEDLRQDAEEELRRAP